MAVTRFNPRRAVFPFSTLYGLQAQLQLSIVSIPDGLYSPFRHTGQDTTEVVRDKFQSQTGCIPLFDLKRGLQQNGYSNCFNPRRAVFPFSTLAVSGGRLILLSFQSQTGCIPLFDIVLVSIESVDNWFQSQTGCIPLFDFSFLDHLPLIRMFQSQTGCIPLFDKPD